MPKETKNIVESLIIEDDEEETTPTNVNTFQDSIKELGSQIFIKHPEKTSNISTENKNGLVRADVLNEYCERNFSYRFNAIDTLIKQSPSRAISVQGFGIKSFTEVIKNIQASFEQSELKGGLDRLRR